MILNIGKNMPLLLESVPCIDFLSLFPWDNMSVFYVTIEKNQVISVNL